MAVCWFCDQEMSRGVGCTIDAFHDNGRRCERLRWGSERGREGPCWDCGVPPGAFHHPGCDTERCPRCFRQAIMCGCRFDEDPIDEEEILSDEGFDGLLGDDGRQTFEETMAEALLSTQRIPTEAILAPVELRHRVAVDHIRAWLQHTERPPVTCQALVAAYHGLAAFAVPGGVAAGVGSDRATQDASGAVVFRLDRPDVMTAHHRAINLVADDPPPWLADIGPAMAAVIAWVDACGALSGDPPGALLEPLACDHGLLSDVACQCWRPAGRDDSASFLIRLPCGGAEVGDRPSPGPVTAAGEQALAAFRENLAATGWKVPASLDAYRLLGRRRPTANRPALYVFGPRGVPGPLCTLNLDRYGTGHIATLDRRYRVGHRWDPVEPGTALIAARAR